MLAREGKHGHAAGLGEGLGLREVEAVPPALEEGHEEARGGPAPPGRLQGPVPAPLEKGPEAPRRIPGGPDRKGSGLAQDQVLPQDPQVRGHEAVPGHKERSLLDKKGKPAPPPEPGRRGFPFEDQLGELDGVEAVALAAGPGIGGEDAGESRDPVAAPLGPGSQGRGPAHPVEAQTQAQG